MEHTRDAAEIAQHFDPARLSPGFYDDPYPVYAALREHAPLHRCADGTWFLTSHADLDRIYRDRERVSSDKKDVFAPKYGVESPLFAHHTTSLVFNDPPYHTRVRRQIVGALTPRVMKAMEPDLVALVVRHAQEIADHLYGNRGSKVLDEIELAPLPHRIDEPIDERHEVRLHGFHHTRRESADDLPPHAGVIRRVVEDEARRVMREQRRLHAVLRCEDVLLV